MLDESVMGLAKEVLKGATEGRLKLATAESCTGGLLSAVLTQVEGLSHAFERGFVVYTDEAKAEVLGVDPDMLAEHGAVSASTAEAMAAGALSRSRADVAVSITGFADAPEDASQAGLVFFGLAVRGHAPQASSAWFQEDSRARVRLASLIRALEMMKEGVALCAEPRVAQSAA